VAGTGAFDAVAIGPPERAGGQSVLPLLGAAGAQAGLYRAERTLAGKRSLGGWVVLADGRFRGALKSGSTLMAAPTTGFINPNNI
jgi:hypothetical protein